MIKLKWEREDPKYHPTWWVAYSVPVDGSFDWHKFERLLKKHFKHCRLETCETHTRMSLTLVNEAENAQFIMLASAGVFDQ